MQSQTSKIILAVIITALVVGGGVYVWQQNDRQKSVQVASTPATITTPAPVSTAPAVNETKTYENKDLGFSFQFPTKLGKIWENTYKGGDITDMKFVDGNSEASDFDLSPGDASFGKTLRTCDDILKKGFNDGDYMPSGCEAITIDNHSIRVVTFTAGGLSNSAHLGSKRVMFQTKSGLWVFSASEERSYADLLSIVKTLKFL